MNGIISFGAYIPLLRLERKAIARAHGWLNPALLSKGKGARSLANWDEDALTMGNQAARHCLEGQNTNTLSSLMLASTTMPFLQRQNASIVAASLNIKSDLATMDVGSSDRCATSALLKAFKSQQKGEELVIASDKRSPKAASVQEISYGDGAAALLVGKGKVMARFVHGFSYTQDFVDRFRSPGFTSDYHWEERWVRDEGLGKVLPKVIAKALEEAQWEPASVKHCIIPSFAGNRFGARLAKKLKISPEALVDDFSANVGHIGCGHPFLMLAQALENAQAGERILVAQFGSGCDVILLEASQEINNLRDKKRSLSTVLKRQKEETNYMKSLVFNRLLSWEKGMRGEFDKKTALSTLHRHNDMLLGFVGGRCKKTGNIQFPPSHIGVAQPGSQSYAETQEPYCFADKMGKVISWSGDYLTFCLSPPNHYGMIAFEEGGRIMMDITDVAPGDVETGMEVAMAFRVKEYDEARGFVRYFWKAVPAEVGTGGVRTHPSS